MRLIDADALKDNFPNARADIFENCRNCTCLDNEQINKIIDSAPTVCGWISVKERLPTSVANKVLVWLEHEDLNGYLGFGHYEKYKGQEIWYDLEHNEAFSIRGYAVTHWMPLPEPPKEENNGK